jgi:hypothetical protein
MKRYKFDNTHDVASFINALIDENLSFHLDDDPEDALALALADNMGKLAIIKLNMIDMWKFCDPWQVLAEFPALERKYMGEDEEGNK